MKYEIYKITNANDESYYQIKITNKFLFMRWSKWFRCIECFDWPFPTPIEKFTSKQKAQDMIEKLIHQEKSKIIKKIKKC